MGNIKLLDVYLDNNIGDDLMLKMFLNHFQNIKFHIVNGNPLIHKTFENNKNLIFLNSLKEIKTKDISHYITIGGSVFNNTINLKGKMLRTKRLVLLSKLRKNDTKIITIGSNLGPFVDKLGLKIVQKELQLHQIITVRDKKSFDLIPNNNKYCFDDIVSSYESSEINNTNIIKNRLGISVHNNKNELVNAKIVAELTKFVEKSLENNKFQDILLFNFDILNENDSKISNLIYENLSEKYKERVKIISYIGSNLGFFLEKYYSCEFLVGFRFHSLILSTLKNQKYLGFSYSNKMIEYAKSRNFTNVYDISEVSLDLLENNEIYKSVKHDNNSGNEHFNVLNEMIGCL